VGGGVGLALLAAGTSRRLGRPKQLVSWEGEPLLRRVAAAACASRAAAVTVVLGAEADRIRPALEGLPLEVLANPAWAEGMASSIRTAVTWARRRGCDALLLAVGDQPRLTAAHLDALIAASAAGERAVASAYDGALGVPALFPAATFDALAALTGDTGARHLLRRREDLVSVAWPDGARDVDTAADLP
jgi:CTP:molybdopterin cytidylyltransferase MocA